LCSRLYSLPGAELKDFRFTPRNQVEEANARLLAPGGRGRTGAHQWLARFLDPFHLDAESWIRSWNEAYAPLPASAVWRRHFQPANDAGLLNGDVFEDGGVAISVGGNVQTEPASFTGLHPIGETWTLTRVEKNLIHHIGNRARLTRCSPKPFKNFRPRNSARRKGNLFHRLCRQTNTAKISIAAIFCAQPHRW